MPRIPPEQLINNLFGHPPAKEKGKTLADFMKEPPFRLSVRVEI